MAIESGTTIERAELSAEHSHRFLRSLISGSSAVGMATLIERGLGFVSSLLAARLGGAHTFGAYSIGLTTATNVAAYAGAGIGTTANRFSGEYRYGEPGYAQLLRSLAIFAGAASVTGAAVLWAASGTIAGRLLNNAALAPLLRISALSVGAIIFLECLRGLLIGQRKFSALAVLSVLSGGGLVALVPAASRHGAYQMAVAQMTAALGAASICILLAGRLKYAPPAGPRYGGPRLEEIGRFGALQLVSMIGINAAGWWLASLVARSDTTLAQMAFYSVAMQTRNICTVLPQLISISSYAQFTERGGSSYGGAGRVTLMSTIATVIVALCVSGPAAAGIPFLLSRLYGRTYENAGLAATLLLATGLIHMSSGPAAARLTIVSLRASGVINGIWTVIAIAVGTWLVPVGGAAAAAAAFLIAHLISAGLTLFVLVRSGAIPRETVLTTLPAMAGSIALGGLGWMRSVSMNPGACSAAMAGICGVLIVCTVVMTKKAGIDVASIANFRKWRLR